MSKQKTLYLILAVACFIGIILIFVFDGYMGLYDTLTMNSGEQAQTITFDQSNSYARNNLNPQFYLNNSGNVSFTYQIDNRNFSSFNAGINVSIWKNQVKFKDVLNQNIAIKSFDKTTVTWQVNTGDIPVTTSENQYTIEIQLGDTLRKILVYVPQIIKVLPPTQ